MSINHPLLRRFENELDIGEHHLEWTTLGEDFFFRPRDADVEVIWCALGWGLRAQLLLHPQLAGRTARKVAKLIDASFARRFWILNEDCALLLCSRYGLVRLNQVEDLAKFKINQDSFSTNPLFSSFDELHKVKDDCNAEIERIKKEMMCSEETRLWDSVQWPWGTHDELRSLVRALGNLIRQPKHEDFSWRYLVRPKFPIIIVEPRGHYYAIPKSALYYPLLRHLIACCPVESERLVVYSRAGVKKAELWPTVEMSSGMPTQHEKLEALLLWCDFLKNKISADEIDELLRPFQ